MTPVKRRHKSSQVLHFRYIVWRFLDDTFLLIVHWKVKVSQRHILASSITELVYFRVWPFLFFLSFGFVRFGFAAFAVSVALIQNNIDFIRSRHVSFWYQRLSSTCVLCLKETCDEISRKLAQATTSYRKLAVLKTCDERLVTVLVAWGRERCMGDWNCLFIAYRIHSSVILYRQ